MTPPPTNALLLNALWPRLSRAQEALLVIGASLFVALCAQISLPLPFTPVPVTGQTFAVLFLAATLGARRSAAALILYLAQGVAGLPVFAPGGAPGAARLAGPTAGYLLAFPAAAFVLGWLVENWLDTAGRRSVLRWLAAVLTAQAIIYAGGVSWLKLLGLPAGQAGSLSWAEAVGLGLTPFLPGVALKAALLSLCLPAGWWAVERRLRT